MSSHLRILFCSLTIFSWLILMQAHPVDKDEKDSLSDSFGFTSNELPKDVSTSEARPTSPRPKRTIGFLRQLFPGLSQIIDRKIQSITRVIFRVVGRLILRNGNAAGGGGGADGGSRKISITLPTYPPSEDDEDTETPTEKEADQSQTIGPDLRFGSDSNTTNTTNSSPNILNLVPSSSTEAETNNKVVRKVRDVSEAAITETTTSFFEDELISSSEATTKRLGLLGRLSMEMRKKRGSQGSGSGSGNFLFDLIRLVAGSGVTPEKDEELNAPRDERDSNNVDGNETNTDGGDNNNNTSEDNNYNAGIPGPLTRLFVLANRGLSNLIQDLILSCDGDESKCQQYPKAVVHDVANSIDQS